MVVAAAALVLLLLAPAAPWALPALVLLGAVAVQVESAVTETLQQAVPDAQRAGVLGLADSVMVAAALLAALATPWLAATLHPAVLLLVLAAGCLPAAAGHELAARRRPPSTVA
jgi:hypothetical protein